MVLLCMITVVSPRLTLLEVVVTVRVTLQLVNAIAAIAAPAKKVNNLFIVFTNCNHSPPSPSGFPREGSGVGLFIFPLRTHATGTDAWSCSLRRCLSAH